MSLRAWILVALVAVVGCGVLSGCQGVEDTKKGPTRQKTT
jgi:hypothetical protein